MPGLFELSLPFQRKVLARSFDRVKVRSWIREARGAYRDLRAELPEIGGRRNKMRGFLTSSTILMPIASILKREGVDIRKIGEIIYDISALAFSKIPTFIRKAQVSRFFGAREMRKWRMIASRSKEREYGGDWVLDFVEGDYACHHGYDIAECGILKFWKSRGLEELVPYLCLTDWAKWKALGIEARRTGTLANGSASCDFRFVRAGGETPAGWPPETMPEWKRMT
jgi:hypothetical protein